MGAARKGAYFGITLERAAKILGALNVGLRTQVVIEPLPPFPNLVAELLQSADVVASDAVIERSAWLESPACSIRA
jgi:hypothetical protein